MFSEGGNASRLSLPLLSTGPCAPPTLQGDSFPLVSQQMSSPVTKVLVHLPEKTLNCRQQPTVSTIVRPRQGQRRDLELSK